MSEDKRSIYIFAVILFAGIILIQQNRSDSSVEITESEIMSHIRYLSHENRKGRYPGTRESKDVISYIIRRLKSYRIKPGAGKSFVQPFDIKTGVELDEGNFAILDGDTLVIESDYIPFSFSAIGSHTASLIFAGYGFDIDEEGILWNDYKGLDVKGKWVVVMRHGPEREQVHSIFSKHSPLHKKMLVARDNGALGIVFVSQLKNDELFPFEYMPGYSNEGIPAIHISNSVANKLLNLYGWSQKSIREKMNQSLKSFSFTMDKSTFSTNIKIKSVNTRAANIVGEIRSGNRKFRDEYILIGAHFDHIGRGGPNSGSRKPGLDEVHPGANDNASGVAGLLELAQKLSHNKSKLKRSVLLVGFDAEERGLLGSKYFLEDTTMINKDIVTMLNLDMIGRMKDSIVYVGGTSTSPQFMPIIDSINKDKSFNISLSMPDFGQSDHTSFYLNEIPVLFFFSGFHDEYHTPDDTWKDINLKGEVDLLNLVYDITYSLTRNPEKPTFMESTPSKPKMSTPTRFRVALGIMPSYGSNEIGLEVDAISRKDGPAAKAGIVAGDVIKSINGKDIKDIYEYMDRLAELKKGMSVPININRNGKLITLEVLF